MVSGTFGSALSSRSDRREERVRICHKHRSISNPHSLSVIGTADTAASWLSQELLYSRVEQLPISLGGCSHTAAFLYQWIQTNRFAVQGLILILTIDLSSPTLVDGENCNVSYTPITTERVASEPVAGQSPVAGNASDTLLPTFGRTELSCNPSESKILRTAKAVDFRAIYMSR
jgi:hypothetical protein